jgi:RHS repeat-associated protein
MTHSSRGVLPVAILMLALTSSELPRARGQQEVRSASAADGQTSTLLSDGSVVLIGGDAQPTTVAVYDPTTKTTRVVGSLRGARRRHTATVLPDGSVLIAGGVGADGQIVADAERFDPSSGELTAIASPTFTARSGHTATVLSDGRVLFTGGDTPGGGGARAELWDAATNATEAVSVPPSSERLGGNAQLLPDGRIRVFGGVERRSRNAPPDEVFDPLTSAFVASERATTERLRAGVVGVLPADRSTDVATTTRISLRFSEPIDARTVAAELSRDATGTLALIPVTLRAAEGGMLLFLTPAAPLQSDAEFVVTFRGARTRFGVTLPAFSSIFRTEKPSSTPDDASVGDADPDAPPVAGRTGLDSPWRKLPPLKAGAGVTALAGQVLLLNGRPLPDVTLEIGDRRVQTDRTGRFLLRLGTQPSGWKELVIEGATANRGRRKYGRFEVAAQIVGRKSVALPYTIWMPALDTKNAVQITSPTVKETVITTPHIPGLELHLPPHTAITDHDGRPVREISITPIPVNQPPFPLPTGVSVPVYFTIQPGGAYVAVKSYGNGRKGAWLVYPNYHNDPIGTEAKFWHYDPEEKGWYVYGMGKVGPSPNQATPNPDVALYEFTGAMFETLWGPGEPGGNGPRANDPVDLSTGELLVEKTDLTVQDIIPLAVSRTYRTGDNGSRAFGIGATHPYAMRLWSANLYTEVDLVLPDGRMIHYLRTSGGTGFTDAEFENTTSPTGFYKSTIVWNGNGWDVRLKDGTVYVFGDTAPLQAIKDRFGNTVTLSWSATNGFGSGIGNLLKLTSPNGRYIALTYDGTNRITQAKDNIGRTVGYEYDGSGRLWKVTDARGGVTEYTYDIAHRMLSIEDPRNIVYLENEYDVNGRVEKQTEVNGAEYEYSYTLNGSGQITQTDVTNPRGYVRRVMFNADRFMTSDTLALGEAIEQTTTYTRLSGSNLVETETDELGRVTRYTYDAKGNVASVTRLYGTADAVTTSFTYDAIYNLVTSTTDPLSHTTSTTYDSQGGLQSTTDALSHQTVFGTNAAGQIVSVTDALSKTTDLTYEGGDLVRVETPLGNALAYFTDPVGRRVGVVDAKGAATRLEYSAHDELTKLIDPLGGETAFTYDGNGNLLALTDARGKTTTWTYDNMDRVATRTDPLTRDESFTYDLNGNLATWTDRKGQVTTYQYDALDRQTFVGFGTTGAPPAYSSTITRTYDAGDRATDIVDSVAGTIERTFDLLDRLTEEVTPEGTVSYTYDDAGRRATMTIAGQSTVSYTFDNADRLTGVARGAASVALVYDDANKRTSLTLPNGIVVEYGFDDDSQVTGMTYKLSGSTLGTLTYGYNAAGQRMTIGGSYARSNLPAALASATYDDANQLSTFGGTSFTYDDNGNLTDDGTRSYTWDIRNQLASLSGPVNGSFAYDAFGRRRSKTIGGTTTQFLYDGLNPAQELSGGTPTANLLSGLSLDEFFARTDSAGARSFLSDGLGSSIALTDASGAVQTEYTYEPFGATSTTGASTSNSFGFTGRETDVTGLYYYRARYYDPRAQRFIAHDPVGYGSGAENPYAYVGNSPSMWSDPQGLCPVCPFVLAAGGTTAGTSSAAAAAALAAELAAYVAATLGAAEIGQALADRISESYAQHGKSKHRHTEHEGVSVEELERRFHDPSTSAAEKQKLKQTLKDLGVRPSRQTKDRERRGPGGGAAGPGRGGPPGGRGGAPGGRGGAPGGRGPGGDPAGFPLPFGARKS